MTINALDNFYLKQEEPARSCMLALRNLILSQDIEITAAWKYGMPFFCYKGKMFCYIWIHKTTRQPYLGIVEGKRVLHPKLMAEKRSRMKIIQFDSRKDLPVKTIEKILEQALNLYKTGEIQIK